MIENNFCKYMYMMYGYLDNDRASDFFQDWWAGVTHGAKNGGSFFEMLGPSISN